MSEKIFKKKTPIVNDCSAPVWGETFEFYYNSHDLHKLVIFLLVKKPTEKARLKSLLKKDKYDKLIYGSVRIGAAKYFTESEISIWKKLEENLNKNCTEWVEFKNPLNRLESAELGISASFSSLTNSPNESPQYSSQNIDTVNTRSADKIPEKIDREKGGRNRSESNRSSKVVERNDSLHESYSGNLGDSFQSNLQENSTENLQKADSSILSEGKSGKKHQDDDTVSFISLSSHYFAESHISGSLMINFKYNTNDRLLSVIIVRAEEYATSQKSSTKIFIKCKIIPKIGNNDKKTSSKFKDTGMVDFKLNYQFNLDPIQSNDTYFICKLYRSETIISKKFIGQVMIPASYILSKTSEELSKGFSDSYQLSPKIPYAKYGFKGSITISTRCDPTSPDGRVGNLEVRVLKANNLSFNNKTDHLDTYVICSLLPRTDKKSRNKSGVIKNSADPEYKFCCTFQNVDMSDLKEHKCLEVTIWTNKSKFVGGTRIGSHHNDYFNENYQDSSKNEQDLWQNMLSHVREWVFGTIPLRYCMLSQNIFKNLTDNVEKLSQMFASKGRVLEFDIKYSTLGKRCFMINLKHVEGISTQNRTIFCKILSASGGVVTKSFTQYLESANERVWNRSIEVGFTEPIETASLEFRIKSHKTSKDIEEHDGTVFGRVLLSKAISTNEWNLPTQDEIDFFNKVIKNPNISFPARLNINEFTKPKKINKKNSSVIREKRSSVFALTSKFQEKVLSTSEIQRNVFDKWKSTKKPKLYGKSRFGSPTLKHHESKAESVDEITYYELKRLEEEGDRHSALSKEKMYENSQSGAIKDSEKNKVAESDPTINYKDNFEEIYKQKTEIKESGLVNQPIKPQEIKKEVSETKEPTFSASTPVKEKQNSQDIQKPFIDITDNKNNLNDIQIQKSDDKITETEISKPEKTEIIQESKVEVIKVSETPKDTILEFKKEEIKDDKVELIKTTEISQEQILESKKDEKISEIPKLETQESVKEKEQIDISESENAPQKVVEPPQDNMVLPILQETIIPISEELAKDNQESNIDSTTKPEIESNKTEKVENLTKNEKESINEIVSEVKSEPKIPKEENILITVQEAIQPQDTEKKEEQKPIEIPKNIMENIKNDIDIEQSVQILEKETEAVKIDVNKSENIEKTDEEKIKPQIQEVSIPKEEKKKEVIIENIHQEIPKESQEAAKTIQEKKIQKPLSQISIDSHDSAVKEVIPSEKPDETLIKTSEVKSSEDTHDSILYNADESTQSTFTSKRGLEKQSSHTNDSQVVSSIDNDHNSTIDSKTLGDSSTIPTGHDSIGNADDSAFSLTNFGENEHDSFDNETGNKPQEKKKLGLRKSIKETVFRRKSVASSAQKQDAKSTADSRSSMISRESTSDAATRFSVFDTKSIFTSSSITGKLLIGLKYSTSENKLEVIIKNAVDVTPHDPKKDKNDTYAKIHIFPDKSKLAEFKTKVIKGTLQPVFNESFNYSVNQTDLKLRKVVVNLYHKGLAKNTFLGQVIIPIEGMLESLKNSQYYENWYPLESKVDLADVVAEPVTPSEFNFTATIKDAPSEKSKKKPKFDALLTLKIVSAANLATSQTVSKAFCKVYLLSDKSHEEKKTTNPVDNQAGSFSWNEEITFEIKKETFPTNGVYIKICDHKKTSYTMSSLKLNDGSKKFSWQDSNSAEIDIWKKICALNNSSQDFSIQLRREETK